MDLESEKERADTPILDAIRAVLKFKDRATIAEIARYAGVSPRYVLDTVNVNGNLVWRDRKKGHITKVDPASVLRKQLTESDAYYFPDTYGAWSVEGYCLRFKGHEALREQLQSSHVTGGIGDSWTITKVEDTEENRAALEAAGLRLWSESEVDDRLWQEGGAA